MMRRQSLPRFLKSQKKKLRGCLVAFRFKLFVSWFLGREIDQTHCGLICRERSGEEHGESEVFAGSDDDDDEGVELPAPPEISSIGVPGPI